MSLQDDARNGFGGQAAPMVACAEIVVLAYRRSLSWVEAAAWVFLVAILMGVALAIRRPGLRPFGARVGAPHYDALSLPQSVP